MKKLKRTTAVALTLGMIYTAVPYAALADAPAAAASATLTQQQAIETAKKYVTIPDGYTMRNASLQEAKGNEKPYGRSSVWMISFSKDNPQDPGNMNLVIDAISGKLLNLDIYQKDDIPIENSITRDEAKAVANEYVKRFDPDKANQLQEMPAADGYYKYGPYGDRNVMHTFRFVRSVDGVPFPTNGITVTLNGKGALRNYNYNWQDDVQFPKPDTAIPVDKANAAFRDALNVRLQYIAMPTPYKGTPDEAQLIYSPGGMQYGGLPMIDAVKGVAIGPDGNPVTQQPTALKPLSDKPGEAKPVQEITKEAALNLVASYGLSLDGYTLDSSNYENYQNNQPIWRFQYRMGDPKDYKTMKNAAVAVSAKTGELLEYWNNEFKQGPYEFPKNPAVSKEKAETAAIEFVKKALPASLDKIALDSSRAQMYDPAGYNFTFARLVNGIPYREAQIMVTMDPNTGAVMRYNSGWGWNQQMKFPSSENVIGLESAMAKFVEKYPLKLQYVPIYEQGKSPYEPSQPKRVQLVYAPFNAEPQKVLNAVTGEWVAQWGEDRKPIQADDIKGHWAEKQLQYFLDRGIFSVKDGKLNPDSGITRAEVIKNFLMILNGPRRPAETPTFEDVPKTDPNYQFIEEAVARKWLPQDSKFRPADIMTREEFADVVTAILGYGKLSDATDTFKIHFKDVSVESDGKYVGDIEIAAALGIMSGWEGSFMPKAEVSKAQAAVVMTKVLDQLKEKQQTTYYITK